MSPALLVWLKLQGRISQSLLCQSLLLHFQIYLHFDLQIMLCEHQDVDVDDDKLPSTSKRQPRATEAAFIVLGVTWIS